MMECDDSVYQMIVCEAMQDTEGHTYIHTYRHVMSQAGEA